MLIVNKIKYELFKRCPQLLNLYNYYLCDKIYGKPIVETIDSTLDKLLAGRVSMCRFGDGEFDVMFGSQNGFQQKNLELGKRLRQIVKENGKYDDFIVCVTDALCDYSCYTNDAQEFFKYYYLQNRLKVVKCLNDHNKYYNSMVTRLYIDHKNKSKSEDWFNRIKLIWKDKDIIIVEGTKTRLGVDNDLFKETKSIVRILVPCENAFNKYDEIYRTVCENSKNKLILLAVGQTATVLAYDLYKSGYWALDVGHIDIEYEWFKMKADHKIAIKGKYVNEASHVEVQDIKNERYNKEIIARII